MTAKLPDDIREALLSDAKRWVLNNYGGTHRKLYEFSDHYASLVCVYSWRLPGCRRKNLKRLTSLVERGLMVEKFRSNYANSARAFTVSAEQLAEIGAEAVLYWQGVRYVVGRLTPEIKL